MEPSLLQPGFLGLVAWDLCIDLSWTTGGVEGRPTAVGLGGLGPRFTSINMPDFDAAVQIHITALVAHGSL
jgi:hypothetical protein